jgi:hypothetical protein
MTATIPFPKLPVGARSTKQLIDNLRNAERPVTIPGISAYRGANRQDIEHTAFEIERQLAQCIAAVRALVVNLNENLPIGIKIDANSFLTDTFNGGHDLVAEVRGMADRLDDMREQDR